MTTGLKWRPHTEKPDVFPNSIVIAIPVDSDDPDDRPCLAAQLYSYTKEDGFLDQEYDERPYVEVFFWCYEQEVVAGVPNHGDL